MKGKVYILGAGCGEYDLITMRGINILKKCDIIIYDNLIDKRLLEYSPENAEKICMGKRSGYHSETQDNINKLLVSKALENKTVVRLKGGDPFVFGRGGEEIIELKKYSIPYEVIPAVSSCIAIPELAGIPVTHRGISRSFHVITGHPLPENLEYYAKSDGTLVFLMGLNNIRKIAEGLIAGGMKKNTPCAVISGNEKTIDSLDSISDTVKKKNIKTPAVIVIGETAGFDFLQKRKSITVTGTKRFTEKLYSELIKSDMNIKILNHVKIHEYKNNPAFENALENIEEYDMLVLTSMNGAEIFFSRMHKLEIDVRRMGNLKFAVIGKDTADLLRKHGIYPDVIPEIYTSSELAKSIVKNRPERILILRAEKGSEVLTDILDENNILYDDIKIYDTEIHIDESYIDTDYIVFGSASGSKGFFDSNCRLSEKTRIVCIGEITAGAIPEDIKNKILIAETYDIKGIANLFLKEENKI